MLIVIRRRNIAYLVRQYESQKILSGILGVASGYLSHMLSGRKSVSDSFCKLVENKLKLDDGWMDQTHAQLKIAVVKSKGF